MPNVRARKILVYLRVSTADQHTENQMPDLLGYLERRGIVYPPPNEWPEPGTPPPDKRVRWYIEKASGYTFDRRLYIKLLRLIRKRRVETLLVWRLDRLGRLALQLHRLFDLCQRSKTNLVSLRENLDLTTATGRFFATVMAGLAEMEGQIRADRQRAGIDRCRERAARIVQLAADGLSTSLVAEEVRIKSDRVERVLKRNGKLWWGGNHPGQRHATGPTKAKNLTAKKLASFIAAGVTTDVIAAAYGVSVRTIQLRMRAAGIDRFENIPPELI